MPLCTDSFEVGFQFHSRMCVLRLEECAPVRAGVAELEAEGGSVLSMGQCPVCVQALVALPYASPGSPRNAKTAGQGGGKV